MEYVFLKDSFISALKIKTLTKNTLDFVLIFTYKIRYYTLQNLSNNFDKNFIKDPNYLYNGRIHSVILQLSELLLIPLHILQMPKYFIKSLTKPS